MGYYSQLGQDAWVLAAHGPEPGFFVEVGACDGRLLSNTLALEERGWGGICVEPNPAFHAALRARRRCGISERCVFSTSGARLTFNTCPGLEELGGLALTEPHDWAGAVRRAHRRLIEVETISLLDLLRRHGAPPVIDYLSLDTEGSELPILQAFDFEAFDVRRWSIEHNHTHARAAIHELMRARGYVRVPHELLSTYFRQHHYPGEASIRTDFDDWYQRPGESGQRVS